MHPIKNLMFFRFSVHTPLSVSGSVIFDKCFKNHVFFVIFRFTSHLMRGPLPKLALRPDRRDGGKIAKFHIIVRNCTKLSKI